MSMPSTVTLVKVDNNGVRMACGAAANELMMRGHQGIINPKRILSVTGSPHDIARLKASSSHTTESFDVDPAGHITIGIKGEQGRVHLSVIELYSMQALCHA